ncbi:uncharacterized protein LOC62_02G002857 [Vanrija pseudolonga]|uniref:Mid2 domain-containing protein n=1 Tax=Vanrija pseudolonga TaxID=143232 RepID=A0AAF1BPF5_9TREE|nr:hypothetical protein LOC62_02G002857 [Vanrija pseudolonga]
MSTVDVGAGVKPPPPTLPQQSAPPLAGSDGSKSGAPVAGVPQPNSNSPSVDSAAASANSTSRVQSLTLAVAQPTANSTSSSRTAAGKTQGYSVITNSQGAQTTVVVACNPNSESCQSGSAPSTMPKSTLIGAIVGGAIGGLIILSLLGWFLCRRRRRRKEANRLEFNYIPDMPSPSPSYSRSHGHGRSPTPSGSRRVMVMPGYAGGDVQAHGSMRRTATTSPGPTVGRNPFNTPEAVRKLDSPLATPTTAMTSPRPIWKPTTPAEHKSMRGEIFTPPSPESPMPPPERVVSATPASPTTWRFDPPSPGGEGDAFFLTPTPPNRRFAPSFRSGYSNNAALSVHGSTHGALSTRTTSTTGSLFPPGFVFGPPPTTPAGTPARPNATFAASTTSVVNPEFPPGFVFGPPPSQRTPATSPLRAEFQLDNLAPRQEDEMTRHSQIGRAW